METGTLSTRKKYLTSIKMMDIVDFHAHILPGADHGSRFVETTEKQIRFAEDAGVSRIIATPHFYPSVHSLDKFLERRDIAYKDFLSVGSNVEVRLGAEVLICNEIENLPELEKLFINGTNCLLLELPFSDFQPEYCNSVYNLINNGINVVIAHADRYFPESIEKLIELGAKLQLNADSLSVFFKRRHLYDWLDRGLVVAIGSDIHGLDKNAYKNFSKAKNKILPYLDVIKAASDKIFGGYVS